MSDIEYEDILSVTKIIDIYNKIRTNTKHKKKIIKFELFFSSNIISILNELEQCHYKHYGYEIFLIKDPKYRIIMSETMHDKIINHLVSQYVLVPSLEKKLINTNVATRKGMGSSKAIFYFKKYINKIKQNHDNIYILKCDIKKYFYNIDHQLLLEKLKRDIKDPKLLSLIQKIIESTDQGNINELIDRLIIKEKNHINNLFITDKEKKIKQLNSLPRYLPGKGLPIGNESSQILAIYYLNELDHYIKETLHIKYYIRYMDDFLLIHHDKKYLEECRKKIEEKVKSLKLCLNDKTQIYDLKRGIDFLGYRFLLKGKKLIILINQQNKKRIKKKLRKLKKKNSSAYQAVVCSYKGYFQVAHSNEFMHRMNIKRK